MTAAGLTCGLGKLGSATTSQDSTPAAWPADQSVRPARPAAARASPTNRSSQTSRLAQSDRRAQRPADQKNLPVLNQAPVIEQRATSKEPERPAQSSAQTSPVHPARLGLIAHLVCDRCDPKLVSTSSRRQDCFSQQHSAAPRAYASPEGF